MHIPLEGIIALSVAVIIMIASIPFIIDEIKRMNRKCPKCGHKGMRKANAGYYTFDCCPNPKCDYQNN